MNQERESVILIPVPSAESVVSNWRNKYDEVARHGIPAHITLIYPFRPPKAVDLKVVDKLKKFFSGTGQFGFALVKINIFPGVIFLEPSPREGFSHLIEGLVSIFPDTPPYGGKHPTVNPHLTIG